MAAEVKFLSDMGRLGFPGEAVFGAGAEALDVLAVLPDGENRNDETEGEKRLIPSAGLPERELGRVVVKVVETCAEVGDDGQCGGGDDAGERNVASGEENREPDENEQHHGGGHQQHPHL